MGGYPKMKLHSIYTPMLSQALSSYQKHYIFIDLSYGLIFVSHTHTYKAHIAKMKWNRAFQIHYCVYCID